LEATNKTKDGSPPLVSILSLEHLTVPEVAVETAPPATMTLATADDFGAPTAGQLAVDLTVPYEGKKTLAVRCTRDGEEVTGVAVDFTLLPGSGRLALSANQASSGDGGQAWVEVSWLPDATCPDRQKDTVQACLHDAPTDCLAFHLWTGRGGAPELSVQIATPPAGLDVDAVKVYVFDPATLTCSGVQPLHLPTAEVSKNGTPGASLTFPSLGTGDPTAWTVLALASKGGATASAKACQDGVRTSDCDQISILLELKTLIIR